MDYFLNAFKYHYADFDGRARRAEYWFFHLFLWISAMVFMMIAFTIGSILQSETLMLFIMGGAVLLWLGTIIPSLAVTVRRLHDTDKSGWWLLLQFIPLGSIVLFVFMCLDGTPGYNQYGDNPKELELGDLLDDRYSRHLLEDYDDGMTV